ncbi:unnamed protein product [Phytophthora lilii]|uniref:Unnamed protein product n=1 Tax=Phytophthora lilii TaxID=2077276 RepID=A0A9W6XJE0_9STRA|nr:unnamed protein product [Phytophthora lilii]
MAWLLNSDLSDQGIASVSEAANRRAYVFGASEVDFAADDHQSQEHFHLNAHSFDPLSSQVPTSSTREITYVRAARAVGRHRNSVLVANQSQRESNESKAEQILAIHRERRRLIQQRYRQKLRNKADAVKVVVQQLQTEVNLLKVKHERLTADISMKNTQWAVIAENFRLFRNGFQPVETGRKYIDSSKQHQFLRKAMAPDVVARDGQGVDALLQIWESILRRQDGLEITLLRSEYGEENLLVASMECSFMLTYSLLLHEFLPHIGEEGELSRSFLIKSLCCPVPSDFLG